MERRRARRSPLVALANEQRIGLAEDLGLPAASSLPLIARTAREKWEAGHLGKGDYERIAAQIDELSSM
ncbi:MAG TPA: hypothetical protein VJK53_00790 [Candidatus Paceibacterota bacterium]